MIGYKGIALHHGILRSKIRSGTSGDIFELNVPKEIQEINNGIAFSEIGYSFCGSMEDVLNHEPYITPLEDRKPGFVDSRLFEIDTLDSECIGSSYHYKAKQIKLVREVPFDEIVDYLDSYFRRHPNAEKKALFARYRKEPIPAYTPVYDVKEIEKLFVRECIRLFQEDMCVQTPGNEYSLDKCKECLNGHGAYLAMDALSEENDLLYLLARSKVHFGQSLDSIEEYAMLKERNYITEARSIDLIYNWMHKA